MWSISKSCNFYKLYLFKMAPKVTHLFGLLLLENFLEGLSKIAQTGHTAFWAAIRAGRRLCIGEFPLAAICCRYHIGMNSTETEPFLCAVEMHWPLVFLRQLFAGLDGGEITGSNPAADAMNKFKNRRLIKHSHWLKLVTWLATFYQSALFRHSMGTLSLKFVCDIITRIRIRDLNTV